MIVSPQAVEYALELRRVWEREKFLLEMLENLGYDNPEKLQDFMLEVVNSVQPNLPARS